jgi:hypothetical protein
VEFVIVLVVLVVVVVVITGPLRHQRASRAGARTAPGDLAELEAARDAKYREIRDAELDHRTGKLSDADFEAVDRSLRAEAIEILRALDRVGGAEQSSETNPAAPADDPAAPDAE